MEEFFGSKPSRGIEYEKAQQISIIIIIIVRLSLRGYFIYKTVTIEPRLTVLLFVYYFIFTAEYFVYFKLYVIYILFICPFINNRLNGFCSFKCRTAITWIASQTEAFLM